MENKVMYHYLECNGVELFTMVFLPEENGQFPTVIYRTPYANGAVKKSVEEVCEKKHEEFQFWLDAGYAVVFQHCRGRGKSSGDFVPFIYEREDGLFLQDWVRKQSFYNGEIYLVGSSYLAAVHYVTAPFADGIKGAVLEVMDCERYNLIYHNEFYKMGFHGRWYVRNYKQNSGLTKSYTPDAYKTLPLTNITETLFGERAEDFEEILRHPNKNDAFWNTKIGGPESHDAIKHANIPILLTTGFYDLFSSGTFTMWNGLDEDTKAKCALAVYPFGHNKTAEGQPINFENGEPAIAFEKYILHWIDSVRGKCASGSIFALARSLFVLPFQYGYAFFKSSFVFSLM